MAVKMISVKCPECGASLDFEEGRKQAYCSYCGSKIMMDNDNEFTYRYIDEAAVKKVDADKMVKLKMLEAGKNVTGIKFRLAIGLTITGALMMIMGFGLGNISGNEDSAWYMMAMIGLLAIMGCVPLWIAYYNSLDESIDYGDKIKIPEIYNHEQKSYSAVKAMFESAGFTNVKCVPLHDLRLGLLKKNGSVESIMVGGKALTSANKRFSPDVPIIINYHSH